MAIPNIILVKLVTAFISKWLKNYTDKFKVDVNDFGQTFEIKVTVNESMQEVAKKLSKSLNGILGGKSK